MNLIIRILILKKKKKKKKIKVKKKKKKNSKETTSHTDSMFVRTVMTSLNPKYYVY